MAWAALGKVAVGAVKGKAKQVATDKLLNRKKKTDTRRPSTKKMMGGEEGGEQKGGALTVRPTTSLVPSSPAGAIQKTEETGSKGNALLVIKTKLVSIDTILKGTLAAEKKAEDVKRKAQERSERKEDEKELEDDSKDGKKAKKFKLAPPKQVLSFWEKIKSFFGKVLLGWLAVRLIDWLPKLMPIVKFLAKAADFIIKVGGFLLNGLVTFIDWGYKAVEGTRGFVKKLFGDAGVKAFDGIAGTLTTVFNLIGAIALASLAFGNENKRQNKNRMGDDLDVDPKTKKKIDSDEIIDSKTKTKRKKTKTEIEIQKKNKLTNKQLDEIKIKKSKINPQTGKKWTNADAIADVKKPKGFAKFFGGVKDLGGKALKGTGDLIVKGVKGAFNMLPDFKTLGPELMESIGTGYKNLKKTAQKRYDQIVDVAKKLKGKYDNALKSAGSYLSGLGTKAKNAFLEKVLGPVKKLLEPIIKKIQPIGDKIMGVLKKIPGYDKITKVLQKFGGAGSEGLMKKLGGKAIPILGGVVNMAFAYDRLASGDSVGGMIEGLSGLLDLSALVGNAAGPGISMGLDAYMFARDFVPQIQQAEDGVIGKLGLTGLKTSMDEIFGKLPKLGDIAKMITGGDKEEVVDTKKGEVEGKTPPLPKTNKDEVKTEKTVSGRFNMKTGKAYINDQEVAHDEYEKFANMTMKEKVSQYGQVKGNANNILPLDVSKVAKKSSSVSDYASYEDDVEVVDGQEAYNKGYSDGSSGSEQSEYEEGGGVTTIIAGNSGGSDEISARLYERG
jgi:hypothetical protein